MLNLAIVQTEENGIMLLKENYAQVSVILGEIVWKALTEEIQLTVCNPLHGCLTKFANFLVSFLFLIDKKLFSIRLTCEL